MASIAENELAATSYRRRRAEVRVEDFSGLNTLASDNKLRPEDLTEAQNVRFGDGYVEKRPGSALYADGATGAIVTGAITSLHTFTKKDGTQTVLAYVASAGKLCKCNGDGTMTAVVTGLTTTSTISDGVSWQDVFYFVNGKDTQRKITSAFSPSALTNGPERTAGVPATTKGIVTLYDRNYTWGDPTYPHRLYFSASANPDDYRTASGGGFLDFPGPILAAAVSNGSIFLSTPVGNFQVQATAANQPIPTLMEAPGEASSQKAFTQVDNSVVFLSEEGLFTIGNLPRLPRGAFQNLLSRVIRPDFVGMGKGSAAAIYDKFEHTFKVAVTSPGGTANDEVLCYDVELARFSYDTGIATQAWTRTNTDTYYGDAAAAKVYRVRKANEATPWNDNGNPIVTKLATGFVNASGDPDAVELLHDIRLFLRANAGTKLTLEIERDYKGVVSSIPIDLEITDTIDGDPLGISLLGTGILGGSTVGSTAKVYFRRERPQRLLYNFLKIRLISANADEWFRLQGYKILAIPRPSRHRDRKSVI